MLTYIKIRIYPNKVQKELLSKYFGTYRFVYNQSLALKKLGPCSITELNRNLISLKNSTHPWLKEVNSKIQQQSIINLLSAYNNYFKNKKHFKEPIFKKRSNKQSCRFPIDAINKSCFLNDKLSLVTELKNISFKCSDSYRTILKNNRSKVRSITLSKTCTDKYFASILMDIEQEYKICGKGSVGIDLGIKTFMVTSDAEEIHQKKWIRDNRKLLSKLQRQLSKKKKDSKNREKARLKLAKKHEKLTNQKEYFMHSIVNKLIDENQIICLESLNVTGMLKNRNLARSIQEKNIGRFNALIMEKAIKRNATVVKVDRWFASSKTCSCCGFKNDKLELKDRIWTCIKCNEVHDRDFNAASNILVEGLRILEENNMVGMSKSDPESEMVQKDCGDERLLLSMKQ